MKYLNLYKIKSFENVHESERTEFVEKLKCSDLSVKPMVNDLKQQNPLRRGQQRH